MSEEKPYPVIAVVGVCASGKSSLVSRLKDLGINCRHIAQEHSYVKDMWQRLVHPDYLICLDVSYPATISRKKLNWTISEYDEQLRRIHHARAHASLIIDTDTHTLDEEIDLVIAGLKSAGIVTSNIDQK